MKILVFGNRLIEKDNLPLKLIPKLQEEFPEIEFIEADPAEDLQKYGKNLKIIDTTQGIDEVKLLKLKSLRDFDKLQTDKIYSMHDFDLGYNLKLLKKMNLIKSVEIICLPMEADKAEVVAQTQLILRKCVAHDMQGS